MKIVSFFTNFGSPSFGLAPSIRIRDTDDNSIKVDGSTMNEVGDGWYMFDFLHYDNTLEYAIACDGGATLLDAERYTYASNDNYVEDIWGVPADQFTGEGTMGELLTSSSGGGIPADMLFDLKRLSDNMLSKSDLNQLLDQLVKKSDLEELLKEIKKSLREKDVSGFNEKLDVLEGYAKDNKDITIKVEGINKILKSNHSMLNNDLVKTRNKLVDLTQLSNNINKSLNQVSVMHQESIKGIHKEISVFSQDKDGQHSQTIRNLDSSYNDIKSLFSKIVTNLTEDSSKKDSSIDDISKNITQLKTKIDNYSILHHSTQKNVETNLGNQIKTEVKGIMDTLQPLATENELKELKTGMASNFTEVKSKVKDLYAKMDVQNEIMALVKDNSKFTEDLVGQLKKDVFDYVSKNEDKSNMEIKNEFTTKVDNILHKMSDIHQVYEKSLNNYATIGNKNKEEITQNIGVLKESLDKISEIHSKKEKIMKKHLEDSNIDSQYAYLKKKNESDQ